jgi:hypothetical protein
MALPSVGGGYQIGDGNRNEIFLGEMSDPQTATATATLTAAQITGGLLVANPSASAASYTLPTGTLVDAVLTNAKIGSTFTLSIVNLGTSSGALTIVAGTGWTLVGSATVAITSSAQVLAYRTGEATYTLYRVA